MGFSLDPLRPSDQGQGCRKQSPDLLQNLPDSLAGNGQHEKACSFKSRFQIVFNPERGRIGNTRKINPILPGLTNILGQNGVTDPLDNRIAPPTEMKGKSGSPGPATQNERGKGSPGKNRLSRRDRIQGIPFPEYFRRICFVMEAASAIRFYMSMTNPCNRPKKS
jgi:hypothetical protein